MEAEREYKRGQLWYVKYDDSVGAELSVGRPALIVSNPKHITSKQTVIVVFGTSSFFTGEGVVKVQHSGKPTFIRCDQIHTIDKSRLSSFMFELSKDEMKKVSDALALSMSYNRPPDVVKQSCVENDEIVRLRVELDVYKKLYNDLTSQIVDARFERQVVVPQIEMSKKENVFAKVADDLVEKEEPTVTEELNIDGLAEKMSTPNIELDEPPKVKIGRPKGSKNKPKKANINKDDEETICEVTGMSPKTAHEIIKWRKKNGPFIDLTDLLFVPRFGNGCMNKYGQLLEA